MLMIATNHTCENYLKIRIYRNLHTRLNINDIPQPDVHLLDGTHRSDEPVSKSMRKVCPGVPIVIYPQKYVY